eukprot:TRINITY_DN6201_c0_g1_i1.p1 TRINITY_DN6201_c0_g1~~TRINITY_DN6201_c0_g1_i1.p1  ORF type:complete len:452 (-),score=64.81 TRINITY_DN6201_c0_g1_i1:415-1770(-)
MQAIRATLAATQRAFHECPGALSRSTRSASSSSRTACASIVVRGEPEAELAASKAADYLAQRLANDSAASLAIFFAKGYGTRSAGVGSLLKARLGVNVAVVGCNSEGGVIGASEEVQDETFALAALAISGSELEVYPFHSDSLSELPALSRGNWNQLAEGRGAALAMCTLPMASQDDPQAWVRLIDVALTPSGASASDPQPPVVAGGLAVGGQAYVDGKLHAAGGFGTVLQSTGSARVDPMVCQGGEAFGPFLEITGVHGDHIITQLDRRNPREVLQPILNGPEVPGQGMSMAGIFVDPTPDTSFPAASSAALLSAALGGRPSCLLRPMHAFTDEGHLILSPLTDSLPYAVGMQLQLHCFSSTHALQELRSRAETDLALNGGRPPDAAIIISCGARGVQLHGQEGLESSVLREVWGRQVPTVGIFAGGEIGPVGLRTYLHAYTTSCLLVRL